MRVLVTSSRNPFALDIVRKLGTTGHRVVASDCYHGASGSHSKYLTGHVITASPRFATDRFLTDINDIIMRFDIELILPTFEEAFYLAARARDLAAGVPLFTGSFENLARLHDKASFRSVAELAGVPVPETVVATDQAELRAAIERFPRYFARAAFSRGGIALLTNTGPLAGQIAVEDCEPTAEQPWLVQPFVDGPMVCSYSIVVDGRITGHCTYRAPEQWAHSTGISFLAVDSAETLAHAQRFVDTLDRSYTGQLSFDYVDHGGKLLAIECNPRTTDGVMLMEEKDLSEALFGAPAEPLVVPPGVERGILPAILADCFAEPIKHLPTSVHDLFHVRGVDAGWHDAAPMLWAPASLVHGAGLSRGEHKAVLAALSEDIVWNGDSITGMSPEGAAALAAIHAQRV